MPGDVVIEALKQAWLALRAMNVPMALMGGLALPTWRHFRATKDVDLLVSVENLTTTDLVQRLAASDFRAKSNPPVV